MAETRVEGPAGNLMGENSKNQRMNRWTRLLATSRKVPLGVGCEEPYLLLVMIVDRATADLEVRSGCGSHYDKSGSQ